MINYETSADLASRGLVFEAVPVRKSNNDSVRGYTARLYRGKVYAQWYQSDTKLTAEYLREYEKLLVRTSKTEGRVINYE